MDIASKKIRLIMKLRLAGITDTAVLSAIERVPRDAFIPAAFQDKVFDDIALPIARGQTISQPSVVAAMTEALQLNDRHKVLEIGTGSGYQAAILAKMARRVYSIERHDVLYQEAYDRLHSLNIHNITLLCGDGLLGWPAQKPFDRIVLTAAAFKTPPEALIDQLAINGIMIAPVGLTSGDQHLMRFIKQEDGSLAQEKLFPVRFVPLLPDVSKAISEAQPTHSEERGFVRQIIDDVSADLPDYGWQGA